MPEIERARLALDWRTSYQEGGNLYGFHVHDAKLKAACEKLGVKIDPRANIAVHVGNPGSFKAVPEKVNVLFTAWEFETIPFHMAEAAKAADLIVVPSRFLKAPFERVTQRRVAVVHLGVDKVPFDPLKLNRAKRRKKGKPFRWLWCAAPSIRKGWADLPELWKAYSWLTSRTRGLPPAELLVKTTGVDSGGKTGTFDVGKGLMPVRIDTRRLDRGDYWRLYKDADAFLFTSRGEGFGLTLAEAMAAALPCVYPPTTAMLDYALGFPCEVEESWAEFDFPGTRCRMRCEAPILASVVKRMAEVAGDHKRACGVGRQAAKRMAAFRWLAASMSFLTVIREFLAERRV